MAYVKINISNWPMRKLKTSILTCSFSNLGNFGSADIKSTRYVRTKHRFYLIWPFQGKVGALKTMKMITKKSIHDLWPISRVLKCRKTRFWPPDWCWIIRPGYLRSGHNSNCILYLKRYKVMWLGYLFSIGSDILEISIFKLSNLTENQLGKSRFLRKKKSETLFATAKT